MDQYNVEKILFLDIETVPREKNYKDLSTELKTLWDKKAANIKQNKDDDPEALYERAGIYAEFGKIICISAGYLKGEVFRVKSFAGHDEKIILSEFSNLLKSNYFNKRDQLLCAHNGKEFDFPYIARRMLINKIPLPSILDTAGKKPWEVTHLDTMELWKFGDYKHYTSLVLLAYLFDIPSPKDDINGSDIARVYWEENDLERIVKYCQKDVLTVAQIFLSYQGKEKIDDGDVQVV
ncbi:MAG: 3'-5' exonuclease [Bacteroidales bacterium]|nr:3'-5' exonuclease [Bacteroidales bacterium]